MLSINTIKSGIQEKEEYYTEDESLAKSKEESASKSKNAVLTTAIAYGKGASELGLSGQLSQSDFKSLFYGFKPGEQERIRGLKTRADNQERLAEDLTFSAPKSISEALHLNQDLRLFEAHTQAVKEVLDEIERRFIQTRIQVNGKRQVVNTGNLTAALIPHHTSRDGDMDLHTHAVVFNGTQGQDGQWRALHNEILSNQYWLGQLYRQKLAQKVQDLGYEIYETKDGFELKGISRQDIEVFSKRSKAIVQKLQQQGKEVNPQNRDEATLTTRKAKRHNLTLEEYQQIWRKEAIAHDIKAPVPKNHPVSPPTKQTASQALNSAISHLSEQSVSFTPKNIYEYVFKTGIQSFKLHELDHQIDTNKRLIPLNNKGFTTVEAVQREIRTVKLWMKGQGQAAPLSSNPDLEQTKLNSGQKEAIARTLTSTDTHQIIHGLSGVGKTTALGILREKLRGTNVEIKGFSPTIEAAQTLQQELGIKTNTVQHLALSKPQDTPNQLWIIDEAGMMSANQMEAIGEKAEAVGARILLVGDKGQNSSVEAGSPLRSLINHGATTHSISQIIRQQNSTQKQAVELIAHGNGKDALELLNNKGYVTEIEDGEERSRTVAKQYLSLSPQERAKTLIVTGTNKERLSITQSIRNGLKAEGELRESVQAVQLVSRNLTKEQSQHIDNYQVGDYIKLHRNYKGTPLQKGKLYKVEGYKGSELILSSLGSRVYNFNPSKFKDKQVFTAKTIEIAVGDNLRWTNGADKLKGQINGKQIKIASFNTTSMNVVDNQGQTQEVSLLQPLPVDYNLVSTSYRAQGKSKKRVIVSATSDPTSSREPFYVKVSRQTKELSVYTQNLEKLREWVNHSNAQENPLELIEEHYDQKQRPIRDGRRDLQASSTRPPESRSQRTARPHRISKQTEQPSDPRQLREDSLRNHLSSESVYRTVDRTPSEQGRKRHGREYPGTNASDRQALHQDSRHQLDLSGYQANHSRYQAESITDRNPHRIRQQLNSTPDIKPDDIQLPLFKGLDELATAITKTKTERELIDGLKQTHLALDQIETKLKLDKLDALASAINQWQLGQDLAAAISSLDPLLQSSEQLGRVETAAHQLQSLDPPQLDLQKLATAIQQWRSEQQLGQALSHTAQILKQFESFKFDGMEKLAQEINNYHEQTALADSLANLSETLRNVDPVFDFDCPELDRLAESITSLQEENLLVDSKLSNQLQTLSNTIESMTAKLVQPVQFKFEKVQELADVISKQQANNSISEHLSVFQENSQAIQSLIDDQLTQILTHLQESAVIAQAESKELVQLVESLESKRSTTQDDSFWKPEYPDSPPSHIKDNHWQEFKKSSIHPDLIALNAESIEGMAVHERLLSDKLTKFGTGQYVTVPMAREMRKYDQVAEDGGWWGDAGIDALSLVDLEPGQQPKTTLWGCFKPDSPRVDQQKSSKGTTKHRKYENPASAKRVPFLPQVSDRLAEQIYKKHNINPTEAERKSGFWYVVKQYPQIPITITEGFKKTLSSLSQGEVTIGLTGVNHIYRSTDDDKRKLPKRQLNPEVAVFVSPQREFKFAYDQDTKVKSIINVRRDMVRGIELLEARGSKVKVLKWDSSDGKGLDDLIANNGASAYTKAHQEAISPDLDKQTHYRTEYNKLAKKVRQELGTNIPDERLDLEIYTRMALKGELADGARVIGESDFARHLKKEQPKMLEHYLQAVSHVAGTYQRLSAKKIPDLDIMTKQIVNDQWAEFQLQGERNLDHNQTRRRGKSL